MAASIVSMWNNAQCIIHNAQSLLMHEITRKVNARGTYNGVSGIIGDLDSQCD
jgi:hypothetical protein